MNEIRPTAKAAKTVVSTPLDTSELVALQVAVEAGGVRVAGGCSAGRRLLPAAPAESRGADRGERDHERKRGHHVRGEVEALPRRQRQHAVAELAHERRLDLRLRLAARDQRLDQRALALGL